MCDQHIAKCNCSLKEALGAWEHVFLVLKWYFRYLGVVPRR